ncbi:Altered inheritance of mitochondria protein 6-like protein [Colletotrichum sp. SAR11_239]|nr:Altered inheritance of mitochondria protein 6-like protein [Colletotrichum sp. SAR11_239]
MFMLPNVQIGCYGICALIIGTLFYCLILRPPRETSLQPFQEIFFKTPEDSGNGDLLVGHDKPSLSQTRTLKSLYLDPLDEILDAQNREVTEGDATRRGVFSLQDDAQIILLIDVKTDAKETWPVVLRQLEPLHEKRYLTSHNSSASSDTKKHLPAPLIVVGTGNLDMATLVANHSNNTTTYHEYHDTFFDAPLTDLPAANTTNETKYNTTNSVYASASFKQAIGSVRLGFSRTQRDKLRSQVQAAKSLGLQPRYWDIPDWPLKYRDYIWTELRAEGVEILSVDNVKHAAGGVWNISAIRFYEHKSTTTVFNPGVPSPSSSHISFPTMAPALHLSLTLLLASLTTARLAILATPDPLIKHIANTNPPAWLSPQACHPRSNFPSAPPVNATDLREDAKRFCARAAELVPMMRPKQVVRGNGLGIYSEQHFQLEFLHPCPHRDVKAQDPQDPMGDGILVEGQSWCVEL